MTPHAFALLAAAILDLSSAVDAFSLASIARGTKRQICAAQVAALPSKESFSLSLEGKSYQKFHPAIFIHGKPSKLAAASSGTAEVTSSSTKSIQRKIYLHLWAILTTAFVINNAKFKPFPKLLLSALTRQKWALVHAISSMLFSGTIIFSAIMEYLVVASKKSSIIKFWFLSVPQQLDAAIVLPALSGAIVSGVGQAYHDYGGLALSPKHVVGAFHLLLTFGVWWMVTDVTSQRKAVDTVQNMDESSGGLVNVPKILRMRVISNIVSCVFVVMMYALMVLKPGFVG